MIAGVLAGVGSSRAVPADQVVEQGAGGRLAALVQPEAGQRGAEVGAPDAGGCAGLAREAPSGRRRCRRSAPGGARPRGSPARSAEHAERAGMGVDQAGADAACGGEAEVPRRPRRSAGRGRWRPGVAASGRAARASRSARPMAREEVRLPARGLVGEIGPLAGQRALRAGVRAGGAPGQEVGEVEGGPARAQDCGQVALQPHQLRRLHLRRHDAADVVEHAVAGGGAFLGFGEGAVVEPEDGVPAVVAGGRDGDGAALRGRAGPASRWRRRRDAGDVARGGAGDSAQAARTARQTARQISCGSCSAWPGAGWLISDRMLGAAEQAPAASKMPARALPVPTSTAATAGSHATARSRRVARNRRAGRACRR